ncbi:MAG: hypothetical protein ABIJ14_03415 [Nanoarchaeota archaeon]|nr:hypothetical protein [Nanoarchaeota archaeon]
MREKNEFERNKSEFWKRFNRSKRLEKKLISISLSYAKSQGIEVSVIPTYKKSFIDSKDLHLIFDRETYDFSRIIDYSKKLSPSMYRRYEEDSDRCKAIFDSVSINLN